MKTKQEFSAGCVVFKKLKDKTIFLLGKHSGYHKWVLPKGLIEAGENSAQTAMRETEEEMGIKAEIINPKLIHTENYSYMADFKAKKELAKNTRRVAKYQEQGGGQIKINKTVEFYLAKYVAGDSKNHGWEMEETGWFEIDQALEIMGFEGEKQAIQKAKEIID